MVFGRGLQPYGKTLRQQQLKTGLVGHQAAGRGQHGKRVLRQTVFQRALADCFGNQWGELGMTAAEYEEITAPYLTGPPSAPGQPPPMIGYRRFACDLMKIAEEQISDQDTKIAMAMRGKATVTPLNQKVAPRR